ADVAPERAEDVDRHRGGAARAIEMRGEITEAVAVEVVEHGPERRVPGAAAAVRTGARAGGVVVRDLLDAPAEEDHLVRSVEVEEDAGQALIGAARADVDVVLRGG